MDKHLLTQKELERLEEIKRALKSIKVSINNLTSPINRAYNTVFDNWGNPKNNILAQSIKDRAKLKEIDTRIDEKISIVVRQIENLKDID